MEWNAVDLYREEEELHRQGFRFIAGTDEAGRGPMAGPLVAAAVILPEHYRPKGLNDSKKCSMKLREQLYDSIMNNAIEVQVQIIDTEEVDRINVYQASKKAMTACIRSFLHPVDYVLTDAMKLPITQPYQDIIKGDAKIAAIAAASIIAKVTRDRIMDEMDRIYPQYGFRKHKGYVTSYHMQMLEKYGPSPIHRKSFAPVREVLMQQIQLDIH